MEHTHGDVVHTHGPDPGRHFHPDPDEADLVRWELPPGVGEDRAEEYEAAVRAAHAQRYRRQD